MSDNYITMMDASLELKVSKARVSQLLTSGALEGMMLGGRRMVSVDSIERYKNGASPAARARKAAEFVLMSADYEVAVVSHDDTRENPLVVREIMDPLRMPFGCVTSNGTVRSRRFSDWWLHRSVPSTRQGITSKLADLGVSSSADLPVRNLGLSLSDCYWLRPKGRDDFAWRDLNYFDNDFEGSDADGWDEWLGAVGLDSPDNTSEGELPKRWGVRNGARVLIKGRGLDDQRPFNEVVATALYRHLLNDEDYVSYELTRVKGEPACLCADFLGHREEYIPAVSVKDSLGNTRGSSTYDRFARYAGVCTGDENAARTALSKMIVCDSILANTDRHWRNFGFIRSIDTLEMRPAPLFDTGNCLWYSTPTARLVQMDWSFVSRPFDPVPERQLALADRLDWFDAAALDGLVDEAVDILAQSESASRDMRLEYISAALAKRVADVTAAVETLRHVIR